MVNQQSDHLGLSAFDNSYLPPPKVRKSPIHTSRVSLISNLKSQPIANPELSELSFIGFADIGNPRISNTGNQRLFATQQENVAMDRSLELRIKGHLYEIREINDEVLDSQQGFPMSKEGYKKTLQSVADCSNPELVDQVANSIKEHIRSHEERPSNRSVRRDARMDLAEEGIVADSYLNRA